MVVPRGPWRNPPAAGESDDVVGLLLVKGTLCREVSLRDRSMLELLGPGDVLQLPVVDGRRRLGGSIVMTAVSDATLIVLGDAFIRAAGRWPSLLATLHRRLEAQRESFAIQALIAHLPRAEHRLLLMLCHLAERWGFVTPEGIVLPLLLTHDLVGQLIGTRRPTASLALRALQSDGSVRRLEDGAWLLTAAAESKVDAITRSTLSPRHLGERLMLSRLIGKTKSEAAALHAEARQLRAHLHTKSSHQASP